MRDGFYRQTARVERRHWWFLHRRRIVDTLLDREGALTPTGGGRALDVGCGTGGNLDAIRRRGYLALGVDRSALALTLAGEADRDALLVRADANRLADCFVPGRFDLVTVFNVLYHEWIDDEAAVLAQIARLLRPGGWLLLTEPAFEVLRRRHDRVDYGARRYTRRGLTELVRGAGFLVRRSTCFNTIGLLPALMVSAWDRLGSSGAEAEETGELLVPPAGLNRLLLALCQPERWWLASVGDLPVGVGVLVLAQSPGETKGDQVRM
jgi:SAM-dependent methyltransferase